MDRLLIFPAVCGGDNCGRDTGRIQAGALRRVGTLRLFSIWMVDY